MPHGHATIGAMWFLIVFFWAKILYEIVSIYFDDSSKLVILTILSISFIEINSIKFLPQSLDLVPLAMLFMEYGSLLSKSNVINKSNILITILTITSWILLLQNGYWIDMGQRLYYGSFLCVLTALASSYCVIIFSKGIEIYNYGKAFMLFGRHTLLILCIHYMDLYDALIKNYVFESPIINTLTRLAEDILIFVLVITFLRIFNKVKSQN